MLAMQEEVPSQQDWVWWQLFHPGVLTVEQKSMQDILGEGPGEAAGQEPAQVEGESFGTELGQDGHIWNVHYKYSVPGSLGEEFAKIRFKQPHVSNWVGQYFGLIDELAIFFDGPSRVPDLPNHRLV